MSSCFKRFNYALLNISVKTISEQFEVFQHHIVVVEDHRLLLLSAHLARIHVLEGTLLANCSLRCWLLLGPSGRLGQLVTRLAAHVDVDLTLAERLHVLRIVHLLEQEVVELFADRRQVNLLGLLARLFAALLIVAIGSHDSLDPDAEVVRLVLGEALLVFQVVALGPGTELKAIELGVVRVLEELEQASDLRLSVTLPLLVDLAILRQNLYLDEVLEGLEERELLEEPLPSDRAALLLLHQQLCYLACLLQLGEHNIASRQRHVVRGVHGGERWRDDREVVGALVRLVKQRHVVVFLANVEADNAGIVEDGVAEDDGVVVLPLARPIIPEERVQQLARLQVRVLLAHVGDKNSPRYTTAVTKDVGVDAATLGPQLDAAQRQLKVLEVVLLRYVIEDGVGGATTVQRLDALVVTVAQNRVVFQRVQVVADFTVLDACEKQIDIYAVEDHLDAWHEGLAHLNKLLDTLVVAQHLRQHAEEMGVALYVLRGHT